MIEVENAKVDLLRAPKICIIHDISEYVTGDIDSILIVQEKGRDSGF